MHHNDNGDSCAVLDPCHRKAAGDLCSYQDVVDAYIRDRRGRAERERRFFQNCRSLQRAIEYAALSKLPSGKRHSHQRRIPPTILAEAESELQEREADLRRRKTFEELHELVAREIGTIVGIGALTVYDVATRIGAFLELEPERVYLHAGTAAGAKALGLDHRRVSFDPAELPKEFRRLRPYEIEDCLCLYRGELWRLGRQELKR